MSNKQVYKELAEHFGDNDWHWSFIGHDGQKVRRVPGEDDFAAAIDKAKQELYASADGSWVDVAGIIVIKNGDVHTIYTRVGNIT